MIRAFSFLIVSLFTFISLSAQTQPKKPNTPKPKPEKMKFRIGLDMGVIMGSSLMLSVGNSAWKTKPAYQVTDLPYVSKSQVWGPERWVTNMWSPGIATGTDALVGISMIAPASVFFMHRQAKKEWFVLLVMYGETFLVSTAMFQLSKGLTDRTRPFVYNPSAPEDLKLEQDARASFFSGHSALAASFCMLTWQFLDTYKQNKHKNLIKWVKIAAFTVPALTATGRVFAGKHYPTDVLLGLGIGGAIGYFIPKLHQIKQNKQKPKVQTHLFPTTNGFGLCLNW